MAGDWQQCQIWDGTYTIDDLEDWWEMRQVKLENEQRQTEYERMMRGE